MSSLAAWQKFLANAPEAQREYRTIELYHPQFRRIYRFVANYVDIEANLEASAPWNANELVEFRGVTLLVTEPAEQEDAAQALGVEFGNVDGTIHRIMDQVSGDGFLTPVAVTYRKYYSLDMTQPASPPLYLFAAAIAYDGPALVKFTAEDSDLSQKRSGAYYTVELFPGLAE